MHLIDKDGLNSMRKLSQWLDGFQCKNGEHRRLQLFVDKPFSICAKVHMK